MLVNRNLEMLGAAAIVMKSDQIDYVSYILCGCYSNEIWTLH